LGDEEDWDAVAAPLPALVDWDVDATPLPPLVQTSGDKYSGSFVPPSSTSGDADKSTQTTDPVITRTEEKAQGDYGRAEVTCCICLESDPNLDFRKHISCSCVTCKDCVKVLIYNKL
jgi:hypothetical protein